MEAKEYTDEFLEICANSEWQCSHRVSGRSDVSTVVDDDFL
jgi:hypothetical protein